MTSDRLARDYLRRAHVRRRALDALFSPGGYPDVVRGSQDLVELILKGALRFVGFEPPKRHDVHRVMDAVADRLTPEWRQALVELRDALDRLAADRGPAFYGDEAEGIPASDLFGEPEARAAMAVVDRLLDLYERLLHQPG